MSHYEDYDPTLHENLPLFAIEDGELDANGAIPMILRAVTDPGELETAKQVPDVWLCERAHGCNGMVIELKSGRNKPTPEQKLYLAYLARQGWQTAVCYDWLTAARLIAAYLDLPADLWPPEVIA